jgi:hypothetical protein
MDPGWVATKMGGAGAPGDINASVDTYVMLAEGQGEAKDRTGEYWYSSKARAPKKEATQETVQGALVRQLGALTGVAVPET